MSEQSKIDAERAAFEAAYADSQGFEEKAYSLWFKKIGGEYEIAQVASAWWGWQASAILPVGVPDGWRRAVYQAEECLTGCLAVPDVARALDAETVRKIIANLQAARFAMLAAAHAAPTVKESLSAAERAASCTKPDCFPYCDCGGVDDPAPTVKAEPSTINSEDAELQDLLNLTADMATGGANQDTATLWMDRLSAVERRLAPSLPAAGSAVEEVEVVAHFQIPTMGSYAGERFTRIGPVPEVKAANRTYEPLMTVTQHERIVAALSAQQSAPERVSVPEGWRIVEKPTCFALLDGNKVVATLAGPEAEENAAIIAALLASHGRGEA